MINPSQARIRSFEVVPSLPEPLGPLLRIANNIWWTWHPEAVDLFVRLDRDLWRTSHHNPVKMLGMVSQERLDEVAKDEGFLTSLSQAVKNLERHMGRTSWLESIDKESDGYTVAYFCAEFGLTESLQIYSGGLGCLAGDHLKSASELGLPLVAVGLLYRNGYFQQYLNPDGWQQEYTPDLDFSNLPVDPVKDDSGGQVKVAVHLPGRDVHVALWKVEVGRIPLYLLDTNLPENSESDRHITSQLYGGDMEMRIKQEIVLGIGGVRALEAIGVRPDVCHMNEGHSAFLALERISRIIKENGVGFDQARQLAAASHVFTTHTPVPAGIDRFPPDMIQRYFKHYHEALGLDMEGLLALGRENVYDKNEFFSMAVLAIRTSRWANGVSRLHGEVSRQMWNNIWQGVPEEEVPISHVTNGVHARSWLSGDLISLLDRYLGSRWQNNPADHEVWQAINTVPDEELWRIHERRRRHLINWTREKLQEQLRARGASPDQCKTACDTLDPSALTIGFARRFATYKRGTLFLRDLNRIQKILGDPKRPIQFLVAGKAHPADGGGKDLIRQIVQLAAQNGISHRIVFLENYDIHVARNLVQGCDVWLNTPRRGMEASGTSGMKAALNGGLNCSILDGWWDEAYESDLGWAIGRGEEYANPATADDLESRALYDLLENSIIPLFYDRDSHDLPVKWIAKMKACICKLAPQFNTNRMVQQYTEQLYLPALKKSRELAGDGLAGATRQAEQIARLRAHWSQLKIQDVKADTAAPLGVRQSLDVDVTVHLGELSREDVRVQLFSGRLDNEARLVDTTHQDMTYQQDLGNGQHRFTGSLRTSTSGRHGFAVRIVPGGEVFDGLVVPGLIHWDTQEPPTPKAKAKPEHEKVA
jgi:glycogen phosphorylase